MNTNQRLGIVFLFGAAAADLATTMVGLSAGLAERNPVAAALLDAVGVFGLSLLSIAVVGAAIACSWALDELVDTRAPVWAVPPVVVGAANVTAAASNALLIASV